MLSQCRVDLGDRARALAQHSPLSTQRGALSSVTPTVSAGGVSLRALRRTLLKVWHHASGAKLGMLVGAAGWARARSGDPHVLGALFEVPG